MAAGKDPTRRNEPSAGFATRAIHYAYDPADYAGAASPPVFFTSTYAFDSVEDIDEAAAKGGLLYAREHNPTTELLEARLANLEGAEAALALASGMAAVGTLMLGLLSQGDEIVVNETMYSNTVSLTQQGLPRFGIKVIPVDLSDPDNLDTVLSDRTRIVYFETPTNPTSDVLNIRRIADRAHRAGAKVVVDSTYASPALQRPLEHGSDVVLHSLTKYINGHGDVLGGVLLGPKDLISHLRDHGLRYLTGATLSPMAAALVLRGLKTLPLRMQRHGDTALAIARRLSSHPAVAWVKYPFLNTSPTLDLAKFQMANGSGMLSFGLHSGFAGARMFMARLQLIRRAVSLGDAESLITHPASINRASQSVRPDEDGLMAVVGDDLIRLSVGLEEEIDIWSDLNQALNPLVTA